MPRVGIGHTSEGLLTPFLSETVGEVLSPIKPFRGAFYTFPHRLHEKLVLPNCDPDFMYLQI